MSSRTFQANRWEKKFAYKDGICVSLSDFRLLQQGKSTKLYRIVEEKVLGETEEDIYYQIVAKETSGFCRYFIFNATRPKEFHEAAYEDKSNVILQEVEQTWRRC